MKINFSKHFTISAAVKLFILSLVITSVTACKDDDETPANYFKIDGGTSSLSQSVLFASSDDITDAAGNTKYNHSLYLLSSGFTISNGDINGTGDAVVFNITSANATKLEAGTYTFTDSSNDDPAVFSFFNAYIFKNITTSASNIDPKYEITSGTIKITLSGTTYTIDFTGKAVDTSSASKDLSIHYSGTVSVIE